MSRVAVVVWYTDCASVQAMKEAVCLLVVMSSFSIGARAQDLVPGAYTPAPVGVNVLTVATVVNRGDLAFDPSLPLDDARATIGGAAVGVSRTLNVAGRFASVTVGIPFVMGHVEGVVLDQFRAASLSGFGDLTARVAFNVYGAPAMTLKQFAVYRATTVVGVSVGMAVPIGEYNPTRYINLGTNRWAFKPELGISRTRGPWTFEGDIGTVFFTDNTDFVNGSTRQQASILAFQGHLIRTFRPGFWVAADGNYWKGGRVTTNGIPAAFEQKNSRLGVTLAVPVRRHQVRFSYSLGAYTTIGGDFHSIGMSYSYAWRARS